TTCAARSSGRTDASAPPYRPIGVRTASMTKTGRAGVAKNGGGMHPTLALPRTADPTKAGRANVNEGARVDEGGTPPLGAAAKSELGAGSPVRRGPAS